MIDRCHLPGRTLLFALLAAASAVSQTPPAVPAEQDAPPALLRAWLLPGSSSDTVTISLRRSAEEAPTLFASTKEGRRQLDSSYREIAQGSTVVELKSGEQVLASLTPTFGASRAYTIVAWNSGAKWELKAFPDFLKSPPPPDRALRVINFVEGRESVVVIDGKDKAKVPGNTLQELRLAPKVVDVGVKVLAPDGSPPFQTSTAFDLNQAVTGYLVIAPDYRGRPDAVVVAGGFEPAPVDVAQAAEPPLPPPTAAQLNQQEVSRRMMELNYRRAQLKALKDNENSPNKIANADELRRKLEGEIKSLQQGVEGQAPTPNSQ